MCRPKRQWETELLESLQPLPLRQRRQTTPRIPTCLLQQTPGPQLPSLSLFGAPLESQSWIGAWRGFLREGMGRKEGRKKGKMEGRKKGRKTTIPD